MAAQNQNQSLKPDNSLVLNTDSYSHNIIHAYNSTFF